MATPALKLTYFPIPGRAQVIRDALTIGGIAFDNATVPFPEWKELKSSGKLPFDTMPVIEIDGGLPLSQSNAIAKYAGKLSGHYPSDPVQGMQVDQVLEVCEWLQSSKLSKNDQKMREDFVATQLPWFADRINRLVDNNPTKSGFIVGDALTIADLKLYYTLQTINSGMFDHVPKGVVDAHFSNYMAIVAAAIADAKKPAAAAAAAAPSTSPTLVLRYFPIGGRAAAIRAALRLGKVPFEDSHVTFADWKELKASGTTPFDGLPTISVDGGAEISQSNAILVYAGRVAGLYPEDPVEALRADGVLSAMESYAFMMPRTADKEELKTLREAFAAGPLPKFLGRLERLLSENPKGSDFFVGSAVSVADLKAYFSLKALRDGVYDHVPTTCVDGFPLLVANLARVADAFTAAGLDAAGGPASAL